MMRGIVRSVARELGRRIAARPEIAAALVEGIEQGVAEGAVDELAAEGIAINPAGHAPRRDYAESKSNTAWLLAILGAALASALLAGCTTSACCPSPAVAWSLYAGPGEHVVAIRANGLELPAKITWTGPGAAAGSQALPVPADGGALDYAPGGCVREVAVEVIAGGAVDGAAWVVCQ